VGTLDDESLDYANGGVVRTVLAGELHDFHAPTYGSSYGHLPTAVDADTHVDPQVELRAASVGTPVLTAASLAQHDAALMNQFDQLLRARLATTATAAQAAQPNPMQQMMSMLPSLMKGMIPPSGGGGGGGGARGGSPSGGQQGQSGQGQNGQGQNGQNGNGEREQDPERTSGDTQRGGGEPPETAPPAGTDAFGNGNTANANNDVWNNGTSAVPYTNAYADAGYTNGRVRQLRRSTTTACPERPRTTVRSRATIRSPA
jgi:hypothetical protein